MKKVLYMNLLFNNSGQRRMDENVICELVKFAEVYVVCPKGWYEHTIKGVQYIYYNPNTKIKNKRLLYYVNDIKNVFFANKLCKINEFDYYIFASYDTLVFPLWRLIRPKIISKSFIIHNNNIDGFNTVVIKKKFFMMYAYKTNHIVLEKFIGDFLVDKFGINKNKVFYLPHPLNPNNENEDKCYDCVGISNSNDDNWIREIIETEKKTQIFQLNNCKVILRSKRYSFNDGYLTVINGWLDDLRYNDYINKAKCIFLPFSKTFQYRMSGSVVDAFSNYTAVIGSKIPLFEYYSSIYGDICKIVESSNDFCEAVISTKTVSYSNEAFDKFIKNHSSQKVHDALFAMLNN